MIGSAVNSVTRLTVLISGTGTNLQALIDKASTPDLPSTQIIRVISNRKNAYGLERAKQANIPTAYHNLLEYKKRHPDANEDAKFLQARGEYDKDLAALVLNDKPDLVVCAGWMHILAPTFLDPLQKAGVPVINLHPALPGQFNGSKAIERAYEAFQQGKIEHTGIMIHYVISEVDMGKPVLVREVAIDRGESLEELEEKIHHNEWQVIVQGTRIAVDELHAQRKA